MDPRIALSCPIFLSSFFYMHKEGIIMANNFMMKLLLLFFGLASYGVIAQISKKPDVASSAIQPGGFQTSTLLTSVINKADVVLHEVDDNNAQTDFNANTFDMEDTEVFTDTEEGDDDELDVVNDFKPEDLAMSNTANSKGGKGIKARLIRYKHSECEKKRGSGKGKKMKEGKCHTLHRRYFQSYQFSIREKKSKKKDEDDESDDGPANACRIIIYHDGKCKDEASTANEESCEDMEGNDDDEDDDKKLHSRDMMKPKGGKYKSARFLCDGVDASSNHSSSETVSEYYSVTSSYHSPASSYYSTTENFYSATSSSAPAMNLTATGSSSRFFPSSSANSTLSSKTISGQPTTTEAPDEDDKEDPEEEVEKADPNEKDEEDETDEKDKEVIRPGSQTTKTKKHSSKSHKKTKGTKKHSKQTQTTVTATKSAETITDS
jgi:hypothetical protein